MARQMGIGLLGGANLMVKKQFQFTFEVFNICGNPQRRIPESFVQTAGNPHFTMEEIQIDFLNARTWIPGKGSWETISVTYLDVAARENLELWNWLASVYNFQDRVNLKMGSARRDYAAIGTIVRYNGCGEAVDQFTLYDLWPTDVDWGENDMAGNELQKITLTLRYGGVDYKSFCPEFVPQGCCTPCTGDAGDTL